MPPRAFCAWASRTSSAPRATTMACSSATACRRRRWRRGWRRFSKGREGWWVVQAWLSPTRAVAPGPDGTRWLGFRYLELDAGEHRLGDATAGFEAALVLVQGEVEVARGG